MRYLMLIPAALAIACGTDNTDEMQADALLDTATISAPGPVTAMLRDSAGRDIGLLTLSQAGGDSGIRVLGRLVGFEQGSRALHIHTTGSCSPDFAAAGPHWNPTGKEHGADNANGPHLGDLQDAEFQSDSSASYDAVTAGGMLRGANGLLDADGAALVLHTNSDDRRTDPDGGSGTRIACGVISS